MIIINLFSSTHDQKKLEKECIINFRIIFVNVYHHETISRNFQETLHFLKMLSSEFMQFKLYFISSDCYYHEVVISTNDRRQFKCLN